jgi:DHA2 family multidrug resistance protein-like MFS transporter
MQVEPSAEDGDLATRREWLGLGVIALPCMLYSMDLTVLNLAVPTLTAELRPSASQMLWIIDIYGFMVAGFLITMGSLGDRIGRRRLLLWGAAAFAAASAVAAFSTSAEMLILWRAILGIAGATLAPATLSLISVMFRNERQRTFAISMWIASFSVGGLIGPLVGGVLIEFFHWGAVFLIAVPFMLLLLALGPLILPEYRAPTARPLDLPSVGLSLSAILSAVYGVKRIAEGGADLGAAAAIAAGLGLGVVFVRRQRRLADPMVDLALFRIPAFSAALAINLVGILFLFGVFVLLAQYFQLHQGLSPLEAGLWSMPSAAAFTVASFCVSPLAARLRPATLMAGGALLASAGFMLMASVTTLGPVVFASMLFSIGFTPVITMTTGIVVGAAPPERTGSASALSETMAELGGALGVALLGSLAALLFRLAMADAAGPDLDAGRQATLAGALDAASRLPSEAGAKLAEAARAAFMDGFRLVAILCALGMAACAAIALAVLRDRPAAPH